MEERKKREPPLRVVDPPEPSRACRMPGCDRPALVGSRCIRHASGLPFPPPAAPEGIPDRPKRRAETA